MTPYATTPCRGCGFPVILVRVQRQDGSTHSVYLDPDRRVFLRIVHTEGEHHEGFWIEDRAPKGECRQSFAMHECPP